MRQGEAGPIHPDHRPGRFHYPVQPGQQIFGVGHGPQLRHSTGDKLIVHCDRWSLARADTVSAVGHRWPHPRADVATEPGTVVAWWVMAVAAGSSLSPGVAWWWPLRAQLPVRGGCSAWRGVAGPDPAGASLQSTCAPPSPGQRQEPGGDRPAGITWLGSSPTGLALRARPHSRASQTTNRLLRRLSLARRNSHMPWTWRSSSG